MKKSLFFASLFVSIAILHGCNQYEYECPYGQCIDEYTNQCVPCGEYNTPPVVVPQPVWEAVPGQGLIYLHQGGNINIGPAAMLDEYGQLVFVYISPSVFGQAAMLAEAERNTNPMFPRPLLVTYGTVLQPIQTGFGPVYRTAVSFSICTLCGWQ